MLVCRNAWQRLAPLTQRASAALLRNAPIRHMSASSVPGSSGEALPYYLFVGVALAAGGTYVYRTLSKDRARFHERHEYIETQLKPQMESMKSDSAMVESKEVSATIEEAVEAAIEEAAAEEVTEQEVVLSTPVEQEQAVAEEEAAPSSSEEPAPSPSEEEPAVSAEVSTEQVEQENTEPVVEAIVVESVPVLEESSVDIVEELASATEDWSELSARKPEEPVEENSPSAPESEEAVESEAAPSS